ncbi:hypothetical protein B0H65DRAFT_587009 [Neurospora tetraspora]|uniref:Uncharacterized protein n=1 Tax=Neurospora tetraspora TaxID=94610 RepID=A0AAE0JL96_9PEZI|nr:hypothetical protein B0H65DRAFT_587009 [Neurospora tetraspora]
MSTSTEERQATINLPFPNLRRPQGPITPPVTPSPPAATTTNEPLSPASETSTIRLPNRHRDVHPKRAIRHPSRPSRPSLRLRFKCGDDNKLTCDRLDINGDPLPKLRKHWEQEQEREREAAATAAAQDSLVPSPAVVVPTTPTRRFSTRVRDRRLRPMSPPPLRATTPANPNIININNNIIIPININNIIIPININNIIIPININIPSCTNNITNNNSNVEILGVVFVSGPLGSSALRGILDLMLPM